MSFLWKIVDNLVFFILKACRFDNFNFLFNDPWWDLGFKGRLNYHRFQIILKTYSFLATTLHLVINNIFCQWILSKLLLETIKPSSIIVLQKSEMIQIYMILKYFMTSLPYLNYWLIFKYIWHNLWRKFPKTYLWYECEIFRREYGQKGHQRFLFTYFYVIFCYNILNKRC